ncbi:hypothetical protein LguiA_007464 [Lonicera macranthoides]
MVACNEYHFRSMHSEFPKGFSQDVCPLPVKGETRNGLRFLPCLVFIALYNFRVLAETQFPVLDDEKWVRSRGVDQKLKGAEIKLWSRLHGSEVSRVLHEKNVADYIDLARFFIYSLHFLPPHLVPKPLRALEREVRGHLRGYEGSLKGLEANLGVFASTLLRFISSAILQGIDPPKLLHEKKLRTYANMGIDNLKLAQDVSVWLTWTTKLLKVIRASTDVQRMPPTSIDLQNYWEGRNEPNPGSKTNRNPLSHFTSLLAKGARVAKYMSHKITSRINIYNVKQKNIDSLRTLSLLSEQYFTIRSSQSPYLSSSSHDWLDCGLVQRQIFDGLTLQSLGGYKPWSSLKVPTILAAYFMIHVEGSRFGSAILYGPTRGIARGAIPAHLGGLRGDPALGAAYPSLGGLNRDRCEQSENPRCWI